MSTHKFEYARMRNCTLSASIVVFHTCDIKLFLQHTVPKGYHNSEEMEALLNSVIHGNKKVVQCNKAKVTVRDHCS